jgi:hypothetical protein
MGCNLIRWRVLAGIVGARIVFRSDFCQFSFVFAVSWSLVLVFACLLDLWLRSSNGNGRRLCLSHRISSIFIALPHL